MLVLEIHHRPLHLSQVLSLSFASFVVVLQSSLGYYYAIWKRFEGINCAFYVATFLEESYITLQMRIPEKDENLGGMVTPAT